MTAVIAEHELFNSCRVLFGAELQVSRNFLEYLQRPGIKSAYRKKALETHPDILVSRGYAANSTDLFRHVQQAYENLTAYLDARDHGFRFQAPPRPRPPQTARPKPKTPPTPSPRPQPRTTKTSASTDQTRTGKGQPADNYRRTQARPTTAWQTQGVWNWSATAIPARKLLFGHFLFYAGVTNWQTIVKALVWQRTGRPRLGEIGRRFGWLNDHDILTVLKRRKLSESFGTSAVALGLLTDNQLRLMLFQQNKLQKKFGEYFVQHHLLTPFQINELATKFTRHNTPYERGRFAFSTRM